MTSRELYPEFADVRIFGTDDEPLFLGSDVAKTLKIKQFNYARDFEIKLDYKKIETHIGTKIQKINAFTEQGLYHVVFRSRSPIGRNFRKFVTLVLKEMRQNHRQKMLKIIEVINSKKENPEPEKIMKTYIMKSPESDWVKIGKSTCPEKRISGVRNGSYLNLELYKIYDRDIEQEMHEMASHRGFERKREWFKIPKDELTKLIEHYDQRYVDGLNNMIE